MIEWLDNNWIEVTGVLLTLVFLYLEVTRRWTMWIVGIISGLFYVYINFNAGLYALSGLRSYDVIVSIYGIYCWKVARANNRELPFRFITKKLTLRLLLAGSLVFPAIAFILIQFAGIENPLASAGSLYTFVLDTLIATLSALAVWMAAKKIVESWFLWLVVNPCTIALYVYMEMYPSVFLYLIYTTFSIVGYKQWRKAAIQQT
ncbi:MAG: nicotinamide riboside transporter PnuC [Dysgonamonadaceae bacterium]|jgi:nicotinamide mononucleotide transporter|nr:nicotinamide riboside transporter PnuC [Dysgonamonadaceae bacterium]